MKKIIIIILVILTIIGVTWFIPIIPYHYMINCDGDCSNDIRTITLKEYITKRVAKRIEKKETEYISPEQMIQIQSLMQKNGKSIDGLKAYGFQIDDMGMTHIRFYIYRVGIKVGETIYHFGVDGTFLSIS